MSNTSDSIRFNVEKNGLRLDVFLAEEIPDLSRRVARQVCEEGSVRVNRKVARAGCILSQGDVIELEQIPQMARARPELVQAEKEECLEVLYEDEDLLVVSKASGMFSVTQRAGDALTLADCIAAYSKECESASSDPREAGLVQRLDYYTSGALIAAKRKDVWQKLHQMLLDGKVEKSYLALVEGTLSEKPLTLSYSLVQSSDGKRMEIVRNEENIPSNKRIFEATTDVTSLGAFHAKHLKHSCSLVKALGSRVHRHQIRVHLSTFGHPLLGDELYGSSSNAVVVSTDEKKGSREGFFLHAESIVFQHPCTGKKIAVRAPSEELKSIKELCRIKP